MPYFRESSISFFWVCGYNKLNKFDEGELVFADVEDGDDADMDEAAEASQVDHGSN
jgi:hypothetical protein